VKQRFNISFKIQGKEGSLSFLRGLVESLPTGTLAKRRISMAIVEAFNNAVFHAHSGRKELFVGVAIKVSGDRTVVEIKDDGKGFDIGKVKEPDIYQMSGRGIFIIKNIMKKVSYEKGRLIMTYQG